MDRLPTATASSAPADRGAARHRSRLFAMSPDLLAAAGFDGLLKEFNDAWEQQLGWTRAELEATPYLELVHPEDRPETEAQIARLARGEAVAEHVCRVRCKDGGVRSMAWSGGPGDEAFYIVGRDVSDRLALERELARQADRLQVTNAELQEFAYTASHDLSEPLRMVASYLGLLERRSADGLDERGRGYLAAAADGAARMRHLIDDLLLYSRVANQAPRRERVDLDEVVAGVLAVLGPAIEQTGARVHIGPLPTLEAEPVQIRQLLQNLIGNAVKFHRPGAAPVVRVGARRTHGGCVVTVADDGIGIPEGDQERIFAMFTRLHGSDEYAGTGIGLAICRRIAERHGGRIYVESEPGRGAAFHTLLPDAPSAPGTPVPPGHTS
ncbi:PAS domain S-box protein [Baekduia soli]|uniref:histidine kinase n=1 Tax=Baekduia soli TaxID=496014 RepID=A0A5B8U4A5_9ACTN|nr:ATP-binding protein [Baekduia soli]QEC47797.1 PAS domain S-box protein [Baekduia soli]